MTYTWTDNAMQAGGACDVDKVNDNLMHLKYEMNAGFKEFGLVPSYVDTDSISISPGQCYASDYNAQLVLSSNTQVDIASPAANTTYHIFLGLNSTDNVVLEYDTTVDGSNLVYITGAKKRVHSVITDSSGEIIQFTADEKNGGAIDITWSSRMTEASTTGSVSQTAVTVTSPLGLRCGLKIQASAYRCAKADANLTFYDKVSGISCLFAFVNASSNAYNSMVFNDVIKTDLNSQIDWKAGGSGGLAFTSPGSANFATLGYIDERIA